MKSAFLSAIYLWILGLGIGALVACGVLSAPVIFHADSILPALNLTRFDMGLVMSGIFERLNFLLNGVCVVILVYEFFHFKYRRDYFALILGLGNVVLILLFTFYYSRVILKMQAQGAAATTTPEFNTIHHQSELVFKILLVLLSLSFLYGAVKVYFNAKKDAAKKMKR